MMVRSFYGTRRKGIAAVTPRRGFPQGWSKADVASSILWFPLKLEQYLIVERLNLASLPSGGGLHCTERPPQG